MSTTRRSVEGPEGRLLPDRILDEVEDPNAQPPGAVRRALARLDGGPPGRLARLLPGPAALHIAHAVSRGLPMDPLAEAGPGDPIDVMIPCHPKDLRVARIAIASVLRHLDGVASELTVAMPDVAAAPAWLRRADVRLVRDDELLQQVAPAGSRVRAAVTDGPRTQMLLKWAAPLRSGKPTLVLDADTVLLRRRTWLVGGAQVLDCRAKHQGLFDRHSSAFLGGRPGRLPSFVTHHQVVQPDLVLALLDAAPGGSPASDVLIRWLAATEGSWPSEYQVYGAHLVGRQPHRARAARWANTTFKVHQLGPGVLPPEDVTDRTVEDYLSQLEAALPTSNSVTFHNRLGH